MPDLIFDKQGYLLPREPINVNLASFEAYFVNDFPNSKRRKWLFSNYEEYLKDFSLKITPKFTQWINGSFVTKKENPHDIDFVTFINWEDRSKIKDEGLNPFWSFSLEHLCLDAYIVVNYPPGHPHEKITEGFKMEWLERFTRIKPFETNKLLKKGFIQLEFN